MLGILFAVCLFSQQLSFSLPPYRPRRPATPAASNSNWRHERTSSSDSDDDDHVLSGTRRLVILEEEDLIIDTNNPHNDGNAFEPVSTIRCSGEEYDQSSLYSKISLGSSLEGKCGWLLSSSDNDETSKSSTNYHDDDDETSEASAYDDDCGSCKKDDCQFMCAICLEDFVTHQDYEDFRMSFGTNESVNYTAMVEKANSAGLVLPCMHKFHSSCLKKHIEADVLFFRCPLCSTYIPTILAAMQGYIRDSSVMHAKSDEDNLNLIYRGYEALVKGRTPPTQVIAGLLTMSIDDYDSKIIVPALVKEILGMMEIQDDRFQAESLVGHSCVPHGRKMKKKIVRTETRAMNEEAARSARFQASAMAQMEEWESRRDYARREINVARSATIRRPERRRATGIRSTISQIFTRSNLREDQPVPPPLSESISNRFRRMLSQVRGRFNSTSRTMRRNSTPNMRRYDVPERPSEASTMTLGRLGHPF